MRVRTYKAIRDSVIAAFQRDYPGEMMHNDAFSIYILDIYCRLVELNELYQYEQAQIRRYDGIQGNRKP